MALRRVTELKWRLKAPQLGRKGRAKDFDAEEEDIDAGMSPGAK